ncbi:MAG TPA: citrate synthase, partial [Bacteroidetes bacterium]|nr:citrate synthase [Bacteroidota bacterium]
MSKSQNKSATPSRGLEGVIALDTAICDIDGTIGRLVYSGYDIRDLARNTSFEEVAYLLWNGALPESHQLEHLKRSLDTERTLPPMVKDVLAMTPEDANPMAVLRTAVSALALFDGEADDAAPAANYRKSVRLTARIPTILAHFDRVRNGLDPQ